MPCVHSKISSALDRWQETHWHIHQIEENYHHPESLRFSLNSLIRSIKEIPQLLSMELQNDSRYQAEIRPQIESLKRNQLFNLLATKRDYIVHRGMLDVRSFGEIGTTEGRRRFKFSTEFEIHSSESTSEAYERYKKVCIEYPDWRALFGPDCDSWPMARREWRLPEIPEMDILDVSIRAWRLAGECISNIVQILGGEKLDLSLVCMHEPEAVRCKEFSSKDFMQTVDRHAGG